MKKYCNYIIIFLCISLLTIITLVGLSLIIGTNIFKITNVTHLQFWSNLNRLGIILLISGFIISSISIAGYVLFNHYNNKKNIENKITISELTLLYSKLLALIFIVLSILIITIYFSIIAFIQNNAGMVETDNIVYLDYITKMIIIITLIIFPIFAFCEFMLITFYNHKAKKLYR